MSTDQERPVVRTTERKFKIFCGCAATTALIIPITCLMLLSASKRTGPNRPWRSECKSKLMQIGLALHNYHDVYDCFPPAYFADKDGKPMHSWRVMLLPFLDESDVFQQYRYNEPWNSPHNRTLAARAAWHYACPAVKEWDSTTHYVAVVGPGTLFPGGEVRRIRHVTDGSERSIAIIEMVNSDIHWMEPRDVDVRELSWRINPPAGKGLSSAHKGRAYNNPGYKTGAQVLFANGRVRFLPEDFPPNTLRAMLTIDGGEEIPAWDD